jgi:hypothetical protein
LAIDPFSAIPLERLLLEYAANEVNVLIEHTHGHLPLISASLTPGRAADDLFWPEPANQIVVSIPNAQGTHRLIELAATESARNDSAVLSPRGPEFRLAQFPGCATSGDLVVANGETCELAAGSYTFDSITVQSGGTIVAVG